MAKRAGLVHQHVRDAAGLDQDDGRRRVGDLRRAGARHPGGPRLFIRGAGSILVSGTVEDLVVGSGLGFVDFGSHELKGVPGEWHLWVVGDA